jgi:hypothetical protein
MLLGRLHILFLCTTAYFYTYPGMTSGTVPWIASGRLSQSTEAFSGYGNAWIAGHHARRQTQKCVIITHVDPIFPLDHLARAESGTGVSQHHDSCVLWHLFTRISADLQTDYCYVDESHKRFRSIVPERPKSAPFGS